MEKRFYDFCKKNGFTGFMFVEPKLDVITFNVKFENYGASHSVSEQNLKDAEERNFDLLGFVFENLERMICGKIVKKCEEKSNGEKNI